MRTQNNFDRFNNHVMLILTPKLLKKKLKTKKKASKRKLEACPSGGK
jgi:hypothetical protein